ncbi:12073_t:CDS:1 [Cetraspora pellucida]|uniref:12073_t:CDS:1 n=1 Tax=Cetraspora pellucida TaxID=1433469 RepID=A0A9N9BGL0_9GLOM|nr:12073_t:CDS:1 [Cetraspora pellucida]
MISCLPVEILLQIFLAIYYSKPKSRPYEQYQTLHSCLLVNRFWCVNVISILWSRVFSSDSLVRLGAINKYISCLNPEKYQLLLDAGMKFPKRSERQLFDYPSFLKELQFDIFLKDLSVWCIEHGGYRCHNLKFQNLMLKTLLELFSERGAKLDVFYMKDVYRSAFPSYHTELKHLDFSVLTSVNVKEMFLNCKKMRLEGDVLALDNIIDIFTSICNNIEHLTLDSPNIEPKVLQNGVFNFLDPTSDSFLSNEIDRKETLSKILIKSSNKSSAIANLIVSQRKLKTLVLVNRFSMYYMPFHHTIQFI